MTNKDISREDFLEFVGDLDYKQLEALKNDSITELQEHIQKVGHLVSYITDVEEVLEGQRSRTECVVEDDRYSIHLLADELETKLSKEEINSAYEKFEKIQHDRVEKIDTELTDKLNTILNDLNRAQIHLELTKWKKSDMLQVLGIEEEPF